MNAERCASIVCAVRECLQRGPDCSPVEMSALRASIRSDVPLDYDKVSLPFAQSFWERNFWKAVYFFEYEYVRPAMLANRLLIPGSSIDVTILGTGSAADAVACLCWLDDNLPLQKVIVTLIDQNRRQLELAREIIGVARLFLAQAEFDVRYVQMSASQWTPSPNSTDLILMSHFLTENSNEIEVTLKKCIASLRPRGDVVVIERQRDPVWQWSRHRLGMNGVTTHDVGLSKEKFSLFASVLPQTELDMAPFYVRGSVPENKRLMELVREYFDAWVRQTSDPLPEIFTAGALYDEKPGIEPIIVGIDGIRRYWDKHPGLQRDIRLTVHNVTYSDTVGVCAFSGDFDTPKQHIRISGATNFYLDPYVGKIHRLTEYFGTIKTPLANRPDERLRRDA